MLSGRTIFLTMILGCCCGCFGHLEQMDPAYPQAGLAGMLGGGALGAGTGALVGSMISNGNIGQSALAGAAVGAGTGIVLGVAYVEAERQAVLAANLRQIERNDRRIRELTALIIEEAELKLIDSATINIDESRRAYHFSGPTIGVYK